MIYCGSAILASYYDHNVKENNYWPLSIEACEAARAARKYRFLGQTPGSFDSKLVSAAVI